MIMIKDFWRTAKCALSITSPKLLSGIIVLVATLGATAYYHLAHKELERQYTQSAQFLEEELSQYVGRIAMIMEDKGRKIAIDGKNTPANIHYLFQRKFHIFPSKRPLERVQQWPRLTWVNNQGNITVTDEKGVLAKPESYPERALLYKASIEPWRLHFAKPKLNLQTETFESDIALGVVDTKGNYIGSIITTIHFNKLAQFLSEEQHNEDITYLLLDDDYHILENNQPLASDLSLVLPLPSEEGVRIQALASPLKLYDNAYHLFVNSLEYPIFLLVGTKGSSYWSFPSSQQMLQIAIIALLAAVSIACLWLLNKKIHQLRSHTHKLEDQLDHLRVSNKAKEAFFSKMSTVNKELSHQALDQCRQMVQYLTIGDAAEIGDVSLIPNVMQPISHLHSSTPACLNITKVDVAKLLKEAITIQSQESLEKQVSFECHFETNIEAIEADELHLLQITLAILYRAIEDADHGGVIHIMCENSLEKEKHSIVLTIRNTGLGIPEAVRSRIQSFGNSLAVQARVTNGTDLPIEAIRYILELHHGRILLNESEQAKGSVFSICLPYKQPTKSSITTKKPPKMPNVTSLSEFKHMKAKTLVGQES